MALGAPQRCLGALLSVSTALLDLRLEKTSYRLSSPMQRRRLKLCLGSTAQRAICSFALLFSPLKKLLREHSSACPSLPQFTLEKSLFSCPCRGFWQHPLACSPQLGLFAFPHSCCEMRRNLASISTTRSHIHQLWLNTANCFENPPGRESKETQEQAHRSLHKENEGSGLWQEVLPDPWGKRGLVWEI